MSVTEIIRLVKNIYSKDSPGDFAEKLAPNLYNTWCSKNKNIIAFLDSLLPEHREKYWKWLTELGVQSIEQIKRIYDVLDAINMKRNQIPADFQNLIQGYNNIALFIGILGTDSINIISDWGEKNISEEDIATSSNMQIINTESHLPKKNIQLTQQQPVYQGRRYNKGVSRIKINPQISKTTNHYRVQPQPVQPVQPAVSQPQEGVVKIRTFDELRKIYNQYN